MAEEFERERDEVVIRGADGDDLVADVDRHLAEAHPDLLGKVSRQDIVAAASDGLMLRLRRVLRFPRAAVYSALTEPRQLAKWWGPRGFTAPSVEFDPHIGGSYRIAMQPPDGDLFHLSGEFREVDPPTRLAYTFRWDPPDPDDRETVVTLTLHERDEGTELVLTHGGFAAESRRALHEEGWTESLVRLERVLAQGPGASAPIRGVLPAARTRGSGGAERVNRLGVDPDNQGDLSWQPLPSSPSIHPISARHRIPGRGMS